jgi:dihydrofolate reductase
MIVTAIAAMDRNGLIGDGMKMPWHLPRDLRRFRNLTMGKPVIMGRRTLESLRSPLDGRLNIVLTHNHQIRENGFRVAYSIEHALKIAEDRLVEVGGEEVMIIGGGMVYESTSCYWDRLLLTVVEGAFTGVTRFPVDLADKLSWRVAGQAFYGSDAKNRYAHRFLSLERCSDEVRADSAFSLSSWLSEPQGPHAELPLSHC